MEIGRNFSMSGINSCHHNLPTYEISLKSNNVEFVRIVVANLKMATGINFPMTGINSGHHYLPTYEISLKSDSVELVRYCGGHFENGDWYTFFDDRNQLRTSLSTHISNFDDIGQC